MGYRKLAGWAVQYSKLIIGVWFFIFLVSSFYAVKLPTVLKGHGLTTEGSFSQVQEILAAEFHMPKEPVILVFEKKNQVSPAAFTSFIRQTLTSLQGLEGLDGVVSPLNQQGMMQGNWAYAMLSFRQEPYRMGAVIEQLRDQLVSNEKVTVKVTGKSVIQQDVNLLSQEDLKKSEIFGIPIALGILVFAFGGVIPAIIPLIVGWVGVAVAMGIMYWAGTTKDLSIFVLNVIPMVGLALSIDFALLLISRFREERKGKPLGHALTRTMETAGRSIVFSAACVFLGLAGTWFVHMPIFQTVALGAMVVLLVCVGANLTLLPALIAIMGPRLGFRRFQHGGLWYRLSGFVMKRPLRMIGLAIIVISIIVSPLSSMSIVIPDSSTLPKMVESRQADEAFKSHFYPSGTSQVVVLAETEDSSKVKDVIATISGDPLVKQVSPFITRSGHMLFTVTLGADVASKQAMDWVRSWELKPEPIPLHYGGEVKYQQEVFDEIFNHLDEVFIFVFVSNFLVLFMAFRSVFIPIKAILLNLVSLAVSFGILTWVFEQGRFGIEPIGIAIMIPVFIFGLVFGISMDYGIFLVSRIYEIYQKTKDNDYAVHVGLSSTSRMITSAAAIMIAVTGSFALAGVIPMKQLGVGIAVAILVDATLIRIILLPSLMKVLGKWNWWAPF